MSAVAALSRDEEFDALRYFRQNLPNRPYCSDDLEKGLVVRGRDMAAVYKHVQPNPPCRIVWLAFDVDRPDAVIAWSDRGAPAPTLVVGNPDIGGCPVGVDQQTLA